MHETLLRLIRNDRESSFYDTLSTVNEKTIHQRCINILLTKVCKYLNGFSPEPGIDEQNLLFAPKSP